MIKLIAIDLDGTLYDTDSRISSRNMEAIEKCLKNDIKIIVTTGKSIGSVARVIKELNLKDFQIASGGAAIIDKDLNIIHVCKISPASCRQSIQIARKYEIGFTLDTTEGFLFYDFEHPALSHIRVTHELMKKVDDLMDVRYAENGLSFTFVVGVEHELNDYLKSHIRDDIKIRRGGPYFLNILNRDAGKVFGLKKILELTEINKEEVMAIGDNNNDLGIIKYAGIGVAMGNAPAEVKNAADFTVSDNKHDGVAEAIYKFTLL